MLAGGVGIGDTTPEWLFDIHKETDGANYMQITNTSTGDAMYSGLLIGVGGDDGWVAHSSTGALHLGRGATGTSINVYPDGDVSIGGLTDPDDKLEVAGTVEMTGFKMPDGAATGFVLTSNSAGEGTWQLSAGPVVAASAAGNVVLDDAGEARVELPESIAAVSDGLRYQLTCIGGFAPIYVAEKASAGVFTIAGGEPGMEISWQVTGE